MNIRVIRDDLKTGDIVLFSGKGLFSTIIKAVTLSKWSHVGMIIREPISDMVLIIESTTLNKGKRGVQISSYSERVKNYKGVVGVRQLLGFKADEETLKRISRCRRKLQNKDYEESYWELLLAVVDLGIFENKENLNTIFCSELVTEFYQAMGIIPNDTPSNEFTPANYGTMRMLDRGCVLDDVSIVKG